MITPLFDVVISVSGNDETGGGIYDVTIIDTYHNPDHPKSIGWKTDMHSLDDAIEFAKGAVTAFLEGTVT